MELLVKTVNDFKQYTSFAKKIHFRCVTGVEFASDNAFYVFLRFLQTQEELYYNFL